MIWLIPYLRKKENNSVSRSRGTVVNLQRHDRQSFKPRMNCVLHQPYDYPAMG